MNFGSFMRDDPMDVDSGATESNAPSNGDPDHGRDKEDAGEEFELINSRHQSSQVQGKCLLEFS